MSKTYKEFIAETYSGEGEARSNAQKMIQPSPNEPCQWCGAIEHKEPTRCFDGKTCAHCGGIHYGSYNCPYSVTQASTTEAK